MKLSEAADRVIDLAGKMRDYYEAELPKYHPNYPLVGPDDETAPPPPEEKKLREFLSTLSEEMLCQLILIMYLGREDFGTDDLAASYDALKGDFGSPEAMASALIHKASLAAYLLDGLEELRKHKINVDMLPLKKKVTVRKR